MKRTAFLVQAALASVSVAFGQRRGRGSAVSNDAYPPVPNGEPERRILNTIESIVKAGDLYANVPAADGRMLRLLTESAGAKNVAEIGTSTGISGLWFSLALLKTGGRLTTFEYDTARAARAKANFHDAGVDSLVSVVHGDAHQTISRLKAPIDVAFIDADKDGYIDYWNKLLPLVRPGGLILAHNSDMVPEYIRTVTTNPSAETIFYTQGGGLAITLKKR